MMPVACSGMPAMSELRVSVDALSGHFGLATDTIYLWIETHGLPAQRVGRKFKLSEAGAWVERAGAGNEPRGAGPSTKRGRT